MHSILSSQGALMIFRRLVRAPFPLRILAFLAGLAFMWLPLAGFLAWLIRNPNLESIAFMMWLLLAFTVGVVVWGQRLYGYPNVFQRYGLTPTLSQIHDCMGGLAIGTCSVMLMVIIQTRMGWVTWTHPDSIDRFVWVSLEGLLVAIAIGFGEELVFRGWLLDELERDYSPSVSLWVSSLIFALLHFIKPWDEVIRTFPQFPGLVILGLLLVWAKRARRRNLGIAIGLHGGLVWGYYLIQVGELVEYRLTAPELWSGVDQNPLAGGLGLLMLGALAGIARWMAVRSQAQHQKHDHNSV